MLGSLFDTFELQKLGVITDLESGVSLLNQWRETCAGKPVDAAKSAAALPKELLAELSAAELAAIERPQFTLRDGEHLRDSLLCKAVNEYAVKHHSAGRAENDLQRVVNLFDHVVRSVDLVTAHPADLPLTAYDIYLTGKGTAEDRAWIFINLLRQLKIDAVVLSASRPASGPPGNGAEEAEAPWLVGVLLDEQVYLFDPALGLAAPGKGKPAGVATLVEAASDPAVLKQFDLDAEHPYRLHAADLKQPVVALVGNTSLWSGRMKSLQSQLTGKQFMVVYDPLADSELGPGLASRVAEASAKSKSWKPASVRIWKYPEAQLAAYAAMNPDQKRRYLELTAPWGAPKFPAMEARMTGPPQLVFKSEKEQFKARLAQVSGQFQEAIVAYTHVRLWRSLFPREVPVPPGLQIINSRAADDAYHWMGVCQFEQGEFRVAVETFQKYLNANAEGVWIDSARFHLALSHAALGNYPKAIQALERISEDHPQYAGSRLLIRRWRARESVGTR